MGAGPAWEAAVEGGANGWCAIDCGDKAEACVISLLEDCVTTKPRVKPLCSLELSEDTTGIYGFRNQVQVIGPASFTSLLEI